MGDAVFQVESTEVIVPFPLLVENSRFFACSLPSQPSACSYRVSLPAWVTSASLNSVLLFFRTGLVESCDLWTAQRTLWLAELFQCAELRDKIIERVVVPQVDRETALLFLSEAYRRSAQGGGRWTSLFTVCLSLCQQNADFLFSTYPSAVQGLEPPLVIAIARGFFEQRTVETYDRCEAIIEALVKASGEDHMLDFVREERRRIVSSTDWTKKTDLICELNSIVVSEDESTVTSPDFVFAGCRWQLSAVVSAVAGTLQVLLRYLAPAHDSTKHRILALTLAVEVVDRPAQPRYVLLTAKTHSELLLPLTEIDTDSDHESHPLSVKLYAKFEGLYSELLSCVGRHAESTLVSQSLSDLPSEEMAVLLQYKHLATSSEDFLLSVIGQWCDADQANQACLVLPHIRWAFLSTEGLITAALRYPALKRTPQFRTKFQREMETRAMGLRVGAEEERKPRTSYSEDVQEQPSGNMRQFFDGLSTALFQKAEMWAVRPFASTLATYTNESARKQATIAQLKSALAVVKHL